MIVCLNFNKDKDLLVVRSSFMDNWLTLNEVVTMIQTNNIKNKSVSYKNTLLSICISSYLFFILISLYQFVSFFRMSDELD